MTVGNYAVHRVWEQQEDLDKSDAYLGRFELAFGELVEHENRCSADGPKIHGQYAGPGGSMPHALARRDHRLMPRISPAQAVSFRASLGGLNKDADVDPPRGRTRLPKLST